MEGIKWPSSSLRVLCLTSLKYSIHQNCFETISGCQEAVFSLKNLYPLSHRHPRLPSSTLSIRTPLSLSSATTLPPPPTALTPPTASIPNPYLASTEGNRLPGSFESSLPDVIRMFVFIVNRNLFFFEALKEGILSKGFRKLETFYFSDILCFLSLLGLYLVRPTGARTFFLHGNALYNDMWGSKENWSQFSWIHLWYLRSS